MAAVTRRARPGDEIKIAEFALKLFEQHIGFDPDRFSISGTVEGARSFYRSQFQNPDAAIIVAEIENEVVGFAYLEKDELNYMELLENGAWLHDIYVDESARSIGVGKQLVNAASKVAKEMGAGKLLLSVAARNAGAQRLFDSAGFRPTMVEMTLNFPDSL